MTIPLPATLSIPGTTAANIIFHGELSARDISIAYTVAWLAANSPEHARQTIDGHYDIDDRGLRTALGMGNSRSMEDEHARYERMQWGRIWLSMDEDFVRPPYLGSMDGPNPLRAKNFDGSLRWKVDPRLVEAFRMPRDRLAGVSAHMLRAGRSRYGVPLMLRASAWLQGYGRPEWEHSRTDDMLMMQMPVADLIEQFQMDITIPPSNFFADVVAPALEDIRRYGDVAVEAELRRMRYRGSSRLGKVRDIQIGIFRLDDGNDGEAFEQRVRRIAAERIAAEEERQRAEAAKAKPFKRPARRTRPGKTVVAVPETSNVVAMPRRPAFDEKPLGRARGFVPPPKHNAAQQGDET